jgi:hypothetical protein
VVQGVITFCGSLLFVPLLGLPGAGLGMLLGTGILVAAMLLMWWTAFRAILGWAAYCSAIFLPYGLAAVIAILGLWARGWGPEWFTWGPLIIIAAGLAAVTIGLTAWIDRRLPGGHERGIYLRTVIGQTLLCPLAKIRSRLRLRL